MFGLLTRVLRALLSVLAARGSREAEILVLRQQLLVLSRKAPKRARLRNIDRLILVWLSRLFPSVLDAIVIVKPETVLRWHRRQRIDCRTIHNQDRPTAVAGLENVPA
jgi:hypothetical protein